MAPSTRHQPVAKLKRQSSHPGRIENYAHLPDTSIADKNIFQNVIPRDRHGFKRNGSKVRSAEGENFYRER